MSDGLRGEGGEEGGGIRRFRWGEGMKEQAVETSHSPPWVDSAEEPRGPRKQGHRPAMDLGNFLQLTSVQEMPCIHFLLCGHSFLSFGSLKASRSPQLSLLNTSLSVFELSCHFFKEAFSSFQKGWSSLDVHATPAPLTFPLNHLNFETK